jgi:predicted transcriptional regulator
VTRKLLEIAADIVQTHAGSSKMSSAEITTSLRMVFQTLREMQNSEATGIALAIPPTTEESPFPEPASKTLAPQDSIQENKVVCLECGAQMRQLTAKHLAGHVMDYKAYKKKYGFTMRTPLAAKSLTRARSKAAKQRGLPENLTKFIEAKRQEKARASAKTEAQGVKGVSKAKGTRLKKKTS